MPEIQKTGPGEKPQTPKIGLNQEAVTTQAKETASNIIEIPNESSDMTVFLNESFKKNALENIAKISPLLNYESETELRAAIAEVAKIYNELIQQGGEDKYETEMRESFMRWQINQSSITKNFLEDLRQSPFQNISSREDYNNRSESMKKLGFLVNRFESLLTAGYEEMDNILKTMKNLGDF